MQLNISARHLDLTPALSGYVHRKVEKAQRYFDSIVWAQAILSVEKYRHIAEIVVHTPGSTFRTKGEAGDLYSAVDLATHKLDLHLSRIKDKSRNHHKKISPRIPKLREKNIMQEMIQTVESNSIGPASSSGGIIEFKRVMLEPYSNSEAIKKLNSNGMPFFIFVNDRTDRICAVYRKGRNGYGIVETEA